MDAVVSYLATFASDFAAALPAKASDPIAWFALIGALLLGSAAAWWNWKGSWAWALAIAVLVVAVRTLADTYSSPVTRGDKAVFAFICIAGLLAGILAGSYRQRSAQNP
jgi:peptidoglycan/LPS O-acetylase OafA/YrhL